MQDAYQSHGNETAFFEPTAFMQKQDFANFIDAEIRMLSAASLSAQSPDQDKAEMEIVVGRIRAQVRFIAQSVRAWKTRHAGFDNAMRLKYSAYEGALCYSDLKRHWTFYRHAMREWAEMA